MSEEEKAELINALREYNHNIKSVRDTLAEIRLQLNSLHGLIAADAEAPDETFNIDNAEILKRLNEADGILETLGRNRNNDCL